MSIARRLSGVYEKILSYPSQFPRHIQLLHEKACVVRHDRCKCGIDQSSIVQPLALEKVGKVIYALTILDSPEYLLLASREPAALDFIRLSTSLFRNDTAVDKLYTLEWIKRRGVHNLIIYLLESIDCKGVRFNRLGKARLSYWNRILNNSCFK